MGDLHSDVVVLYLKKKIFGCNFIFFFAHLVLFVALGIFNLHCCMCNLRWQRIKS